MLSYLGWVEQWCSGFDCPINGIAPLCLPHTLLPLRPENEWLSPPQLQDRRVQGIREPPDDPPGQRRVAPNSKPRPPMAELNAGPRKILNERDLGEGPSQVFTAAADDAVGKTFFAIRHAVAWPNAPDQRPGATDLQLLTRARSPGPLHLDCYAAGSFVTAVLAQQFHHVLAFVVRRYL
jgi:hypothetical protein